MRAAIDIRLLRDAIARRWRDMLRIALQTALAAGGTYGVMTWFDDSKMTAAVVAALFTIELSVDASYRSAIGRITGAFLGVVLGLAAAWSVGPVIFSLAAGAALANMVAAVWPNLRYAAVTAAIVGLDRTPEIGGGVQAATAIMIGTSIGVAASLVVWPVFGRERSAQALQMTLKDCQDLLDLIAKGSDRRHRDALHARFLGHLRTAHARIAETRFRPRLPSGTGLRQATTAVETVWHTLVILDRVLSEERGIISRHAADRLRPPIRQVQEASCDFLEEALKSMTRSASDSASSTGAGVSRGVTPRPATSNGARL